MSGRTRFCPDVAEFQIYRFFLCGVLLGNVGVLGKHLDLALVALLRR
jgi:hypothetical protein